MGEEKNIIISLQIPKVFYTSLKEEADKKYTSVSHIVRDLIMEHCNEGGE